MIPNIVSELYQKDPQVSNKGCILLEDSKEKSRAIVNERLLDSIGLKIDCMVYFVWRELLRMVWRDPPTKSLLLSIIIELKIKKIILINHV